MIFSDMRHEIMRYEIMRQPRSGYAFIAVCTSARIAMNNEQLKIKRLKN